MEIRVSLEGVQALRARIAMFKDALSDLGPAYARAAVEVLDAAQMQFSSEGDPPWEPKKHPDGMPLLVRTGSLKESLQAGSSSAIENIDGGIRVGTNIQYAPYQQYGTQRGIPPRPFLWRNPEDLGQKIRDIFAAHIAKGEGS